MADVGLSQIGEITRSMLDVPFNDFEMFHNLGQTGTIERGGTCIFLTNEFLRRLPENQQMKIVAAISQVHYATVLEIDGQQYFYDPFLRMETPVLIPQERNESVDFGGHPQDVVKEMRWRLLQRSKRGRRRLQTISLKRINDVHSENVAHIYKLPLVAVSPMPEFDLTYERKTAMDIEILEAINGARRAYTFRCRLEPEHVPMSAYSSGGAAGHINYRQAEFASNLEPILGRMRMRQTEFMEYVKHAVQTRARLRVERFIN